MLGSLNNILVYQAGGRLVLDEPFRVQPSSATIPIQTLDGKALTELGTGFAAISDVAAVVSTLSLTLPATTLRQRTIVPTGTTTYVAAVDALTDPGYQLLVNRGGRIQFVRPSEFAVSGANVTSFRLDDGLDFTLTAGDTAKGVRVQYDVDWSAVTAKFVGQVQVIWKVTISSKVHVIKRIYDVVRQVLHCPATWESVKSRRQDIDQQTTNIQNKESCVQQAWEDVQEELRQREVYCHLVVPHGSNALRDAVVYRCLYNLASNNDISVPSQFSSGLNDYLEHLEAQRDHAMGALVMFIDKNEDGKLTTDEQVATRRIWLRGRRRTEPQTNKVSPS